MATTPQNEVVQLTRDRYMRCNHCTALIEDTWQGRLKFVNGVVQLMRDRYEIADVIVAQSLSVAYLGICKGGFQYRAGGPFRHLSARSACARGVWGHAPQENFWISGLLRSLLVQFWGERARIRRPAAKCSHSTCDTLKTLAK